ENDNDTIKSFLAGLEKRYKPSDIKISSDILSDKTLGGWNGRAAGCLLGKPIEKYSRSIIKEILTANNTYPLENYITAKGIPENLLLKYPWNKHSGKESLRENIECMTEDDDLNYTMLNLSVLENIGKDFTNEDIANAWLNNLPVLSVFTAERVAYINLLENKNIKEVPVFHNPYREWIGAMIRADVWGWVSPGNPLQAATLAYKDASLSHLRNGIYGSMFLASAIALSFIYNSPEEILKEALNFIPEESKIFNAVNFGITCAKKYSSWENVLDELQKKYVKYFWVHSINNTALISASLIFGKGDYEKSICCAVMGGWDTDSDAASVGSIIGTILGNNNLPGKWIKPLNNKIRSSLKGFDNSKISELANRTFKIAKLNQL
ncbi:MAG TPA: ADP-ribosylglycohydrolase family protein, partial [Ignavibacteriaceae bacterium]|nr:ADP-ribosylglycohydrolase family protein [Ignavibacteriaceae bacterium]